MANKQSRAFSSGKNTRRGAGEAVLCAEVRTWAQIPRKLATVAHLCNHRHPTGDGRMSRTSPASQPASPQTQQWWDPVSHTMEDKVWHLGLSSELYMSAKAHTQTMTRQIRNSPEKFLGHSRRAVKDRYSCQCWHLPASSWAQMQTLLRNTNQLKTALHGKC